MAQSPQALRIDKWLWHARFCKTRGLAQQKAEAGLIRLNGQRIEKASVLLHPGDVLTLPKGSTVVALRILALGTRRGPPSEACGLYELIENRQ